MNPNSDSFPRIKKREVRANLCVCPLHNIHIKINNEKKGQTHRFARTWRGLCDLSRVPGQSAAGL